MAFSSMTTRASLANDDLLAMEVELPNMEEQRRISSILSRYDTLISNYQKQITILEESAQRLYKEWFVDLHFPGYMNTSIQNGVPKEWERKSVGELLNKVPRSKQIPTNEYLQNGTIPIIDQSRNYIAGYTNNIDSIVEVKTDAMILFGDHTRVLKYLPFSFARGADGTQLVMSNDLVRMPQCLFYNALLDIDLSNYSYARHFKYLKIEELLIPTENIAQKFKKMVDPWYSSINKYRGQIRLLTEARDRLLSKLMNGEINV